MRRHRALGLSCDCGRCSRPRRAGEGGPGVAVAICVRADFPRHPGLHNRVSFDAKPRPHRPASSPRRRSGVPSFLRMRFRRSRSLRKSADDGLVMRVDWCVWRGLGLVLGLVRAAGSGDCAAACAARKGLWAWLRLERLRWASLQASQIPACAAAHPRCSVMRACRTPTKVLEWS